MKRICVTLGMAACVLLLPGPLSAQRKELVQLQADVIRLSQQVSQLQTSVDEKNNVIRGLVEKIFDQVNGLGQRIDLISGAVAEVRSQGDKNTTDLRASVTAQNGNFEQVQDGLNAVRSQLTSLSQQIAAMKTTSEPLATPESLMRTATADFLAANYDLAIAGFREFQSKFPADVRSADSQMYVADAFYNQKKFEQAIIEYDLLLQKFSGSDKTGTALYKKGLSLAELKQNQQALEVLRRVVSTYPNSTEAAGAQQKIRDLTPPARRR